MNEQHNPFSHIDYPYPNPHEQDTSKWLCRKCGTISEEEIVYCSECLEELITKDIALKFVDEEDLIYDFEFYLNTNLWNFATPDDFMKYLQDTQTEHDKKLIEYCLQHEDLGNQIDDIMEELR
jgi:hypothetical protein